MGRSEKKLYFVAARHLEVRRNIGPSHAVRGEGSRGASGSPIRTLLVIASLRHRQMRADTLYGDEGYPRLSANPKADKCEENVWDHPARRTSEVESGI